MHRRAPLDKTFRQRLLTYGVPFLLIVGIYALLHTRYRIFYVDDAWYLSFVYNYAFLGEELDTLVRSPGDPRAVLFFGKLSAILHGAFLDFVGWTKGAAHILSTLFLFLAAGVWYAILKCLRFTFEVRVTMALGMLVFPAFFSAANLTRPDTLAFLVASLAFLLFLRERYFLAGFVCVVAAEVHIMGVTAAFYMLAYALYERAKFLEDRKGLAKTVGFFLAGTALGCLYYYFLHFRHFDVSSPLRPITQHPAMAFPVRNYVVAYFFGMDWLQKLPELVFTVAMLLLFSFRWRRHPDAHPFVSTFLFVAIGSTFILSRPNSNYMLYVQPAFLLTFIHSFELLGRLKRYSALVFGYFFVYYGVIGFLHKDFEHQRVTQALRARLVRSDLPVIGMMDNWFVAMDRTFFPIYPSARPISKRDFTEAYLIRNDYVRARVKNYDSTMEFMKAKFELTRLAAVPAYNGHTAEVYLARRKAH